MSRSRSDPAGATLNSVAGLRRAGLIPDSGMQDLSAVARRYGVAISAEMLELIAAGDPADPIARQFVPDAAELETRTDESADPIGDHAHSPLPGLVHRYPDRVLLLPTAACAVYCRYCFRRERVGPGGGGMSAAELDAALGYIGARPQIWEVILSGGDPLVLAPDRLAALLQRLEAIPHLGVIRIHSRVPVAAPNRITAALVEALHTEKALFLAVHANHPREFAPAACEALRRLSRAGIALLGQSVLLRGVNDDAETLEALLRRFVENRVKPYYLHQFDPAPGTVRFRTPLDRARALVAGLRGRVSGLCQPVHVLDIPGGHGKSPLGPDWLSPDQRRILDWQGHSHTMQLDNEFSAKEGYS